MYTPQENFTWQEQKVTPSGRAGFASLDGAPIRPSNNGSAAAARLKRVQQIFIAGHAQHSFAAGNGFLWIRENPIAAAAGWGLRSVRTYFFRERFSFHAHSFPRRLVLLQINICARDVHPVEDLF
jgi:hypothetical protein